MLFARKCALGHTLCYRSHHAARSAGAGDRCREREARDRVENSPGLRAFLRRGIRGVDSAHGRNRRVFPPPRRLADTGGLSDREAFQPASVTASEVAVFT